MSSWFGSWRRGVFSDPSLKRRFALSRPVMFAIVLLESALIVMGIVRVRETSRATFSYAYVFSNFVSIFGVTYLFC